MATRGPYPSVSQPWKRFVGKVTKPKPRPAVKSIVKPAAPKPPAPAAAPTPQPTGQAPWDARYESTVAGVNRNVQGAEANYAADAARLQHDFFDPNNAFNRATLLKQTYDTNRRTAQTSLAAQGQLYSGAYQNAQDATLQNYQHGQYDLQTSYDDSITALVRRRQQARDAAADTLGSAEADRLDSALANRPEDPGAPALAAPAAAPKAGSPAAGGPKPPGNYVWDPSRHQWAYSGPPPSKNHRFDPVARKWVRK